MSVRHALLALLSEGPKYGLQLREEFEARTGDVWPLNVGQVYQTLQRLERDGLVESDDGVDGPQKGYQITTDGSGELSRWLRTPPDLASPPRDELVMKVLVALRVPGTDIHEVIQAHRRYLVQLMQQWTRIKESEAETDLGLALVVDAELFRLDAVVRWLDTADGRLKRAAVSPPPAPVAGTLPRLRRRVGPARGPVGREPANDRKPTGDNQKRGTGDGRSGTAGHNEDLRIGGGPGARPARRQPVGRRGDHGRGHGSERLGQVHPADHRRQPGGALQRSGAGGRPAAGRYVTGWQGPVASAHGRVRVPGLQPAARPDRGRERGAAAGAG